MAPADESATTAVYRDHKRQIEADFAAGTITRGGARRGARRAHAALRRGACARPRPPARTSSERSRWIAALVLVACVPVIAGVLYVALGNPSAMTAQPSAGRRDAADPQRSADRRDGRRAREALAGQSRGRRRAGRCSAARIARSAASTRRCSPTAKRPSACRRTPRFTPTGPKRSRRRRDAASRDSPRSSRIARSSSTPTTRKRSRWPARPRWNATIRATAIAMWTKLRAHCFRRTARSCGRSTPRSPGRRIGATRRLATAAPRRRADARHPRSPRKPQRPARPLKAASRSIPSSRRASAPGDTVFIFARDPDGSRMPLAAMKIAVADLPHTFALTDAMAMTPAGDDFQGRQGRRRSARQQDPATCGRSPATSPAPARRSRPGARDVRVTIDRVVP